MTHFSKLPIKSAIFILLLTMIALPAFSDENNSSTERVSDTPPISAIRRPGGNGIFVDPTGREVLLRGVNVNSLGEYWQYDPERPPVLEFTDSDMDMIASLGLNLVRLIVTWSTIEPAHGQYDEEYLSRVSQVIGQLWSRNIYTLIDLHQDAWGPTLAARENELCGEGTLPANGWDGAPAWATLVEEATPRCAPAPDGNPNREMSPAVRQAWLAFLNNAPGPGGVGLQHRYASMLEHLAFRLSGLPGVMGIDLINEPNAIWDEEEYRGLEQLYRFSVEGVRRGEARTGIEPRVIVFEPSGIWAHLSEGGTVRKFSDDPQLAYGPHIYQGSISSQPLNKKVVERIRSEAAEYGGLPVLIGEWGANLSDSQDRTIGYFDTMLTYQDQEHWGMALWQYQTACGDPHVVKTAPAEISGWGFRTLDCDGPEELAGWNQQLLRMLTRPALQFAPGQISTIGWNAETHVFEASGDSAEANSLAVLFIPQQLSELEAVFTGLDQIQYEPSFGGQRITARANAGRWSIRVSQPQAYTK